MVEEASEVIEEVVLEGVVIDLCVVEIEEVIASEVEIDQYVIMDPKGQEIYKGKSESFKFDKMTSKQFGEFTNQIFYQ